MAGAHASFIRCPRHPLAIRNADGRQGQPRRCQSAAAMMPESPPHSRPPTLGEMCVSVTKKTAMGSLRFIYKTQSSASIDYLSLVITIYKIIFYISLFAFVNKFIWNTDFFFGSNLIPLIFYI